METKDKTEYELTEYEARELERIEFEYASTGCIDSSDFAFLERIGWM